MDYGAGVVCLVLGIVCLLAQVMEVQSAFRIPCPPPFPDFEAIFARTLRLNNKFRHIKLQLQSQLNRPPNCSCSPEIMSNVGRLNDMRCTRTTSLSRVCPTTTSTAQATWPTRPTPRLHESTSFRPIPPAPTTVTYSTRGGGGPTSSPTLDKHRSSSLDGVNVIDLDSTTPLSKPTGLPPGPTAKPVTTRDERFTIIVIAVGAGVLLLIFLIGCLLLCRKRLCAGSGAPDAHLKREKVQRLRSDCQPISAISRGDTCEDSYAPSMISSIDSVASEGYRRGYVTNGRKWRPEFDSEAGSEKSVADAKYILLREDSSASALSFSNHYNTLRTLESPHALMMGGFGESSTDMASIPRTAKKKRRITANGDACTDSIDDPMEVMPNSNAMRRKQSKDSLNSIEIYDRVTKARNSTIPAVHVNGTHGPPPSARRVDRGDESDSCSLATIDQEDEGLKDPDTGLSVEPVQKGSPEGEQPVAISVRRGIINLSFQAEDPNEKVDENWQNKVIDQLKRESAVGRPTSTAKDDRYDSLLNSKNSNLFGYENKLTDSTDSHIDPPSDFRDSKDSELSVAVVLPLKKENPRFFRKFSRRESNPKASGSSPPSPSKKQPPPIARKPQNGSVKNRQSGHESVDPVSSAGAEAQSRKDLNSTESSVPMVNGYMPNGDAHMVNSVGGEEADDVGKVKKLIRQREASFKPSAHVQPTRYGDTRL